MTEKDEPRFGQAASTPSEYGKVVVVHYDVEHDGETYKAGVQDLPVSVADALIADGSAYEPDGKKKGR